MDLEAPSSARCVHGRALPSGMAVAAQCMRCHRIRTQGPTHSGCTRRTNFDELLGAPAPAGAGKAEAAYDRATAAYTNLVGFNA